MNNVETFPGTNRLQSFSDRVLAIVISIISLLLSFTQQSFSQNKLMDKTKNHSVEIIRYNVPAEQRADFENAYANAGEELKKSIYCLGYEVIHGVDEPEHFIVRIHWTSVDDHLNKFRKSEEFKSFFNLVKPFFSNIEEMKHYESTATYWNRDGH